LAFKGIIMAGLFSSGEQDMLGNIVQGRQQANQALGSPYGKYGGIVQAGAQMADVGADAMFGGKTGAADPRMQQANDVKNIFAQVAMEVGNTSSAEFYEKLSQALSAKYPEQAQKAADKAMEIKSTQTTSMLTKEQLKSAELKNKQAETSIANEKAMTDELKSLGSNPSDSAVRNVLLKYGDADKIMADMTRRENAKEAAEARRFAATEAAKARTEAAKERAANKLANKPKDVAEREAANIVLEQNEKNLDKFLVMLEGDPAKGIEPSVDFGYTGQLTAWADSKTSNPSKATLQMGQIRKAIARQVELVLQAAKGTQTEGDAKRAAENILNALEGNSNSGIAQSLRDLKAVQQTTMQANKAYAGARGYGDESKGSTPKRPLSDFNK
jgi:hypothetical protein